MNNRSVSFPFTCVVSFLLATTAYSEPYPIRPVRLVVPVSPGATTDTLARLVAQEMSKNLGQQFVIDNRAGASGMIGTELVARATPDGYTLLVITSTHTINPSFNDKLPYKPLADFSPITLMGTSPTVLVVHPSVPVKNLKDLIALAKASPGMLNFGSGGTGSPTHLAGELFKSAAGIQINHVPYKGAGPAFTDVVSGQIQFIFSGVVPALPMISVGKVRPLGATSLTRIAVLPDVPTIAEAGLPSFEFGFWYAALGPAGMNPARVNVLNNEFDKALTASSVKTRFAAEGGIISTTSPQRLVDHMKKELNRYQQLVRAAGIKAVNH